MQARAGRHPFIPKHLNLLMRAQPEQRRLDHVACRWRGVDQPHEELFEGDAVGQGQLITASIR